MKIRFLIINFSFVFKGDDMPVKTKTQSLIYAFLLICLISSGCNETVTEFNTSESFMPLMIGNKWYYSSYTNSTQPSINNITQIWEAVSNVGYNGMQFCGIKRSFISGANTVSDTVFYSVSNNMLIQLIKKSGDGFSTTTPARFDREVNSVFSYSFLLDYQVTVTEKTDGKISFFYNAPIVNDEEYSMTFHKGSGIYDIFSSAWGNGFRLVKTEFR